MVPIFALFFFFFFQAEDGIRDGHVTGVQTCGSSDLVFSEFHHSPNKELIPSEGSTGINYGWTGDVKYHFGATKEVTYDNEKSTRITLAHNPSHLEFVNQVVEGFAWASQVNRYEKIGRATCCNQVT